MRDDKGRFLDGASGNPNGRPQGSASRLGRELQEAAKSILPLWIKAALKGDEEKQRFILERGLPRLKAQLPNVEVDVKGTNDAEKIRGLFESVTSGEISSSNASEMTLLLLNAGKMEEFEKLKSEVETLKLILSNNRERPKL